MNYFKSELEQNMYAWKYRSFCIHKDSILINNILKVQIHAERNKISKKSFKIKYVQWSTDQLSTHLHKSPRHLSVGV